MILFDLSFFFEKFINKLIAKKREMYSNFIMFVFVFIRIIGINSQGCLPVDRSPNNPPGTDCDTTFFDLVADPDSNCICCGVGQIDDNPANECLNANPPTPVKQASGTLTCNENFDWYVHL